MMNAIAAQTWDLSTQTSEILNNEIHVWRIAIPSLINATLQLKELLSEEENLKSDRFHFDKENKRFIISHAATRYILSGYTHSTPEKLAFRENDHGKPVLENHCLHFNLSHSEDFALIAITAMSQLGIDVEKIVPARANLDLAKRFFSPLEYSHLEQLQNEDRIQGFFNAWTRKEAYIKAKGGGLSIPLDSFSVSLKPQADPQLLEDQLDENAVTDWSLVEIQTDQNYASALAFKNKQFELKLFDWLGPN